MKLFRCGFNPDLFNFYFFLIRNDRSGTLALCPALPGSTYAVIFQGLKGLALCLQCVKQARKILSLLLIKSLSLFSAGLGVLSLFTWGSRDTSLTMCVHVFSSRIIYRLLALSEATCLGWGLGTYPFLQKKKGIKKPIPEMSSSPLSGQLTNDQENWLYSVSFQLWKLQYREILEETLTYSRWTDVSIPGFLLLIYSTSMVLCIHDTIEVSGTLSIYVYNIELSILNWPCLLSHLVLANAVSLLTRKHLLCREKM